MKFYAYLGLYLYCNIMIAFILIGITEANDPYGPCVRPFKRIEFLVPGIPIGCWLGKPIHKEK